MTSEKSGRERSEILIHAHVQEGSFLNLWYDGMIYHMRTPGIHVYTICKKNGEESS